MEQKNKIFMYLLVIFFAVFVGTGLFLAARSKNNESEDKQKIAVTTTGSSATLKQETLVIPTVAPTTGLLELNLLPGADGTDSGMRVGENIGIKLAADSNGENIVGYDVVLRYDPLSFDFIEAKSDLADFKIYSYNRSNYLLLTAVKSLDSTASTIMGEGGETGIATLIFKSKKAGEFNFSLRQSAGQDVTDLVTDQTEVLIPALTDLSVEVK